MNFDQGIQVHGATQEKKEADYSGIKCKRLITMGAVAAAAGVTFTLVSAVAVNAANPKMITQVGRSSGNENSRLYERKEGTG